MIKQRLSLNQHQEDVDMNLSLKNSKGFPVNNIPVALVDINKKTIYKSNTGNKGKANFYLYSGRNYELDINGEEGFEK